MSRGGLRKERVGRVGGGGVRISNDKGEHV